MPEWSSGYVADIGYTFGSYGELNPLRLKLAFLNAGLAFPASGTACELGFGQGMSVNIHAAASLTEWHGTDFNPAQAGFAQELAAASGARAALHDQSFAEFCARDDLPQFDFIGLHGIWSWISDENRSVIVDFLRRKLKVGGVLYVSYNTLQGWAATIPMRELMIEHSAVMAAPGKHIVPRVEASLDFVEQLFAVAPVFTKANPAAKARIEQMKTLNRSYLAHEYFNRDWLPMSFSTMAKWLEPAKLSFACSAHYPEQLDMINFTAEQTALLQQIDDPYFGQTVRDFMVNQQFRRDYWVRGARKLTALQQHEQMLAQRVALVVPAERVALKTTTVLGEVSMQPEVYGPVLDFLADHRTRTIGEVANHCSGRGVSVAQTKQAVFLLAGLHMVKAIQDEATVAQAKLQTDRLNRHICLHSLGSSDVSDLASPATGGAVGVGRFQQMFLLARAEGATTPQQWAAFACQTLARLGQRLTLPNKTIENDAQQAAEMEAMAVTFEREWVPILTLLGVTF
jgi:hypothetical protein